MKQRYTLLFGECKLNYGKQRYTLLFGECKLNYVKQTYTLLFGECNLTMWNKGTPYYLENVS